MKMKFNLKEIDFKDLMLKYGEWIGLGVAAIVAVPLLVYGIKMAVFSDSPSSNAKTVTDLSTNIQNKIQREVPPPDTSNPPPEVMLAVNFSRVDPNEFRTDEPWFVPSAIEDTKRREPVVQAPQDFHIDFLRLGIRQNIIIGDPKTNSLRVLVVETKEKALTKRQKRRLALAQRFGSAGGAGARGAEGGKGGGGGPGMMAGGGPPGMQGMMGMMSMMTPGGAMGAQNTGRPAGNMERTVRFMDLDKVSDGKTQNIALAETIMPVRAVLVTGAFPYKQQMEAFRQALHKQDLGELYSMLGSPEADWRFMGFEIQRRVLDANGKEKSGWEDYTQRINEAVRSVRTLAVGEEPEDESLAKYDGMLTKGLIYPLPVLASGSYPKVDIPSLREAMAALDKVNTDTSKRPLSDLARRLSGKGEDDPILASDEEPESAKKEESPSKPDEKKIDPSSVESQIPEKVLIRFYDPTVEAGNTYEYRVKVKMANPNYHQKGLAYPALGKEKTITASDWTPVPKVTVPYDGSYYAVQEAPAADNLQLEIHKWVDMVLTDPENQQSVQPVAQWSVAERSNGRTSRGEFIGRVLETKVPIWKMDEERFALARNPRTKTPRVPVDFHVKGNNASQPALLVDYTGGKSMQASVGGRTIKDEVPLEVLVLDPDGRLRVHTNTEDIANNERKEHYDAWKKAIEEAESTRRPTAPGNVPGGELFNKGAGGKGGS